MNFFLCTTTDNTTQNISYKIKFSYLCTPLIRLLKKIFTRLNFLSCVPPLTYFNFFASASLLFWEIQFRRCVRGFWRQILVYTLLFFFNNKNEGFFDQNLGFFVIGLFFLQNYPLSSGNWNNLFFCHFFWKLTKKFRFS